MAIQGIDSGNVNWNAVIGDALANKGTEGAKDGASVVLDGDNVTISVRDPASGTSVSRTVALPQLREGSVEADAAKFLNSLADEIDQLATSLKAIAQDAGEVEPTANEAAKSSGAAREAVKASTASRTTNAQQALFSIYELMALMQQIAQQQRNSAREIRMTELQSEVASIKSQADYQRQAAVYGMIVSAVSTAVQGAMLVGTSVAGVKGLQKMDQTGAGQAVSQAKADVKILETAVSNPNNLTDSVAAIANKTPATAQANVETRLQDVTAAKTAYTEAKAALAAAPENAPNRAELQTAVDNAKANLQTKLNEAVTQMDAEYAAAADATKTAEGKYVSEHSLKHPITTRENYKAMGEAQANQSALGAERTLLKAKVAEAKAQMGDTDGLTADLEAARGGVHLAERALKTDPGYHLAMSNPAAAGAYQQLAQMVGTMGQSLAQVVQASEEAKATEQQAAQKELEVRREETTALFQQAQELITSVRDLLKAVIQAESQSVEQIIRA